MLMVSRNIFDYVIVLYVIENLFFFSFYAKRTSRVRIYINHFKKCFFPQILFNKTKVSIGKLNLFKDIDRKFTCKVFWTCPN